MYGLPLDHLQRFVTVLHYYMFTIDISMKLLKNKKMKRQSLSMFVYLVSTSVSVLLANAMGLLFWMSAALRPYSLASVCRIWGCVQS